MGETQTWNVIPPKDGHIQKPHRFDMKMRLLILAAVFPLVLGACNTDGEQGDVSPQSFTNALTAIQSATGELGGRIVFPSEYSQHSIRFSLGPITFVTHPDGRFHVTRVPTGTYLLRVHKKGYEPVSKTVTIPDGGIARMHPLRMVLARGVVLGRLVHEKGRYAKGLAVRLYPGGGISTTGHNGMFRFVGVGPGEHFVRVMDPQYTAYEKRVVLKPSEKRNLGNITVFQQSRENEPTARLDN